MTWYRCRADEYFCTVRTQVVRPEEFSRLEDNSVDKKTKCNRWKMLGSKNQHWTFFNKCFLYFHFLGWLMLTESLLPYIHQIMRVFETCLRTQPQARYWFSPNVSSNHPLTCFDIVWVMRNVMDWGESILEARLIPHKTHTLKGFIYLNCHKNLAKWNMPKKKHREQNSILAKTFRDE